MVKAPAPNKRRRLKPAAKPPAKNGVDRLSGDAYLAIMEMLGHNHQGMASALGVTKWCSIAWRSGRRRIPPIAETAIRGLLLKRYAGDLAAREVDKVIERLKA